MAETWTQNFWGELHTALLTSTLLQDRIKQPLSSSSSSLDSQVSFRTIPCMKGRSSYIADQLHTLVSAICFTVDHNHWPVLHYIYLEEQSASVISWMYRGKPFNIDISKIIFQKFARTYTGAPNTAALSRTFYKVSWSRLPVRDLVSPQDQI